MMLFQLSPLFPFPAPLSLPPTGGHVIRPLHGHSSLGMMATAVTFIVVVVVVLLSCWLSCWLSCCSRIVVVCRPKPSLLPLPPMLPPPNHQHAAAYPICCFVRSFSFVFAVSPSVAHPKMVELCNHPAQVSSHHACAEDGNLKCPHLPIIDR